MYEYAEIFSIYKEINPRKMIMGVMPLWFKFFMYFSVLCLVFVFLNTFGFAWVETGYLWLKWVYDLSFLFFLMFSSIFVCMYSKFDNELFGSLYEKHASLFQISSCRKANLRGLLLVKEMKKQGYWQLSFIENVINQLAVIQLANNDMSKNRLNGAFLIFISSYCLLMAWKAYYGHQLFLGGVVLCVATLIFFYIVHVKNYESEAKLIMEIQMHLKSMALCLKSESASVMRERSYLLESENLELG